MIKIFNKVEELRSEIDEMKGDLVKMAEDKNNLQAKKVVDKSQELDELIVSYMKGEVRMSS